MIPLTRPDGSALLVNPNRIEMVEETPDTVITMADGKKLLVRESAEQVADRFLAHQRAVHAMPGGLALTPATPSSPGIAILEERPPHGPVGPEPDWRCLE